MGLPQHTHEMTWRCVAIVGFEAFFFCNIVARWVYLYTRMRCAAFGFEALFYCEDVRKVRRKPRNISDRRFEHFFKGLSQSTESPILCSSCGHETPFSDQKVASKIGDSVLRFEYYIWATVT
jgi:hypothetical protein